MPLPDFATDERLVTDTEKVAFDAFDRLVAAKNSDAVGAAAVAFADVLGSPGEFAPYAQGRMADRLARIDHLLRVFLENTKLLVHKTWVEKNDEKRKEKLIEEIMAFEREFREGAVKASFRRFVLLCHSIAHLLFGAQSRADDFLSWAFRIDPKLGLFFWFVEELDEQVRADAGSDELLTVETVIGMYVLSCF